MKRLIALLVVLGFFVGVVSMSEAATAAKKAPAKKVAAKKVVAKKVVAKKVVKKVVKKAVKAAPKVAPVAPAPPPPPMAPVPPPAPVAVKAAPTGSLFGWGVNTMLTGSYISTGKTSSIGGTGVIRGDWVMDDMVGLGPMVGLSTNAVKFTLGTGVASGSGLRAIPLFVGGIIMLPADMMGGMSTYLSGGLNYVLYGNGKTSGKIGGEANVGLMADLGMGLGKTGFQIGWSAIRSNTVTSKGFQLSVCQPINL
jgi:hypothetical protein